MLRRIRNQQANGHTRIDFTLKTMKRINGHEVIESNRQSKLISQRVLKRRNLAAVQLALFDKSIHVVWATCEHFIAEKRFAAARTAERGQQWHPTRRVGVDVDTCLPPSIVNAAQRSVNRIVTIQTHGKISISKGFGLDRGRGIRKVLLARLEEICAIREKTEKYRNLNAHIT